MGFDVTEEKEHTLYLAGYPLPQLQVPDGHQWCNANMCQTLDRFQCRTTAGMIGQHD